MTQFHSLAAGQVLREAWSPLLQNVLQNTLHNTSLHVM